MKNNTFWAVIQKGELLYREKTGQMSVFKDRKLADFLADDWADPSENLKVVKVKITILNKN